MIPLEPTAHPASVTCGWGEDENGDEPSVAMTAQQPVPRGLICFPFLLPAEKAEGRFQPRPAHALWVLGPLLTMSAHSLLPALEMRERGLEHLPGQDLCK